ncbi:hypothetical protein NGM33_01125 [Nocardiopsis dassonvillei]|jgi:hypothetical protein|uniref:hypothetical protein n=1 Tax=Nocardiopsis dassonvillei TaxID=2014 RepID=UPI00102BB66A|nr:hypothetical protein [Nocardiopsis dassonvillei]MCP3011915.1 hypothetical protein [Nocardiopsis dassonvillei]
MNADAAMKEAMGIEGAIGVAVVDYESGMSLGTMGGGHFDLEMAAAANTEVVRAKTRALGAIGLDDRIEDILITLSSQYHLIRLLEKSHGSVFLYLALDRQRANLAMARHTLRRVESELQL